MRCWMIQQAFSTWKYRFSIQIESKRCDEKIAILHLLKCTSMNWAQIVFYDYKIIRKFISFRSHDGKNNFSNSSGSCETMMLDVNVHDDSKAYRCPSTCHVYFDCVAFHFFFLIFVATWLTWIFYSMLFDNLECGIKVNTRKKIKHRWQSNEVYCAAICLLHTTKFPKKLPFRIHFSLWELKFSSWQEQRQSKSKKPIHRPRTFVHKIRVTEILRNKYPRGIVRM